MILAPLIVPKFFDNNGAPLNKGQLFCYVAGSTTKQTTYTDSTGGTPNTNPVILDFRGECSLWLDTTKTYKFVLAPATDTDPPTNPFWTRDNVAGGYGGTIDWTQFVYDISAPETSASITPKNLDRWVYDATPYNDLFRYMSQTQINSIESGGSVDTAQGWKDAAAMMNKANTYTANAGNGLRIIVPAGNYPIASTVTLPRKGAFIGAGSRRGTFGPTGGGYGCGVQAYFAGPVFSAVEGSVQIYDLLLEGFNIIGNSGTYGAGHGVLLTKTAGVKFRDMVLASFGTDNLHADGAGGYNIELDYVYSAQAGNANIYIANSDSVFRRVQTDGGVYSVYAAAGSDNLSIGGGCHFEGATNTLVYSLGTLLRMSDAYLRSTVVAAVNGLYMGGNEAIISNNELFATASSGIGIDSPVGVVTCSLTGNKIKGFATAGRFACQDSNISGGVYSGTTTGVELIDTAGNASTIDGGAVISGPTNSIKYTSGTRKWRIGRVSLGDGSGNYKSMTLTAGVPLIEAFSPKPEVSVNKSAVQSINVTTYTALTFDQETFDTDTMHDNVTNNTRLTARIGGKYRVTYSIQYAAAAAGTYRGGRIRKNAATLLWNIQPINSIGGGNDDIVQGCFVADLAATEYVELEAYQASAGALNVQNGVGTQFMMEFVGDS